jgi:hypothetical protein
MTDIVERLREWTTAVWDNPRNGTRYCVRRREPIEFDGWSYMQDERGGVMTFPTREAAMAAARAALRKHRQ